MKRRTLLTGSAAALIGTRAAGGKVPASDRISVGFVGVGGRGTFLLQNMLQIPAVRVRAICDIRPERLEAAEKITLEANQERPEAFTEWKNLLDRTDIDAVVSALPCHLHAANYLDTVAAGKDLYAEKPMGLSAAECDAITAAAKRSKTIFQVGFQRRADPRFIEAMEQVHGGELGQLIEGRIHWSNAWGPMPGWYGHRRESGDWMVEQAVHNWDVLNWANRCLPLRAAGFGRSDIFQDWQPGRDVHDYYSGVVQYSNGVIVNIIHSWIAPTKFDEEYTRLIGTRGGIDFNSGTFSYRKDQNRADRAGYSMGGRINNTLLSLQAFVRSVQTRQKPSAGPEQGREAVLSCLLMRTAVYTGRVVTMQDLLANSNT